MSKAMELLPEKWRAYLLIVIPDWPWYAWLILALIVAIAFLLEQAYCQEQAYEARDSDGAVPQEKVLPAVVLGCIIAAAIISDVTHFVRSARSSTPIAGAPPQLRPQQPPTPPQSEPQKPPTQVKIKPKVVHQSRAETRFAETTPSITTPMQYPRQTTPADIAKQGEIAKAQSSAPASDKDQWIGSEISGGLIGIYDPNNEYHADYTDTHVHDNALNVVKAPVSIPDLIEGFRIREQPLELPCWKTWMSSIARDAGSKDAVANDFEILRKDANKIWETSLPGVLQDEYGRSLDGLEQRFLSVADNRQKTLDLLAEARKLIENPAPKP